MLIKSRVELSTRGAWCNQRVADRNFEICTLQRTGYVFVKLTVECLCRWKRLLKSKKSNKYSMLSFSQPLRQLKFGLIQKIRCYFQELESESELEPYDTLSSSNAALSLSVSSLS